MTLKLEIPSELETELRARATAAGVSVETLAIEALTDGLHSAMLPVLYAHSLQTGGPLTALSAVQEDIHEYSDNELKAMEEGGFERPLQ